MAEAGGLKVQGGVLRTEGGNHWNFTTGSTDLDTLWTHVAYSVGPEGGKIYVNGILDGTAVETVTSNSTAEIACQFLRESASTFTDILYGCVNNAAFFNDQLSDDAVLELYQATLIEETAPFMHFSSSVSGAVSPSGTWEQIADSVRGYDTVLYATAYVADSTGLVCEGVSGSTLATGDFLALKTEWSMACWVKRTDLTNGNRGIYAESSGTTPNLLFSLWDGYLIGGWLNNRAEGSTYIGGDWTHVALTFGPAGTFIYVNGIQDGYNAFNTPLALGVNARVLGCQNAGVGVNWPLQGILDEYKQWQRQLTQAEILADKNAFTPTA